MSARETLLKALEGAPEVRPDDAPRLVAEALLTDEHAAQAPTGAICELPHATVAEEEACDAAALVVFRAEHDSIPLGIYTTREAAREHCRVLMERAEPDRTGLHWKSTDDQDPAAEEVLAYIDADGDGVATDFVVTPIAVQIAYDPEGDE